MSEFEPSELDQTITGIPLWLLHEYLQGLGGRRDARGTVRGDGWRARLTQVEDYQIGSLRVGRVRLRIDGRSEAVAELRPKVEKCLIRGSG